MEVMIQTNGNAKEENMPETLFSYLDKGIDDMEAGRMHTVDEAFSIINDRLKSEL